MIGVGRLPRFLDPLQKVRLGYGYNWPRLGLGRGEFLGLGRGCLLGLCKR